MSDDTAPLRAREAQLARTALKAPKLGVGLGKWVLWISIYLFFLTAISLHLYRNPEYSTDSIQYMGNAILTGNESIPQIHARVYSELTKWVPEPARGQLTGNEPGAPADQNRSREVRAHDSRAFAQFLPFFAIRPLYNLTVRYVSETGLGLLRSTVLISIAAYFFIGLLLLRWMQKYVDIEFAAMLAFLTMIAPPLTMLGRENTSDALATLIALAALYLIFETEALTPGLALLLASIYFRTDLLVLAGPVILVCWLQGKIKLWHGLVLSSVAVASVLGINYFAGDYGFGMLYYRNFTGTPIFPGEMTVWLTWHDYLAAFRTGISRLAASFFLPFLLAGIGAFWSFSRLRAVLAVTMAYAALHFIVLPNWEERWFGVFYATVGLATATLIAQKVQTSENSLSESTFSPSFAIRDTSAA
jgi:hypothetical protein